MVVLGLILVALGALLVVLGVFTAELSGMTLKFAGIELGATALFFVGAIAVLLLWWGLWILKAGSKRSWARRKEHKRLEELSAKLDDAEARRRKDLDEDRERPSL